MNILAQNEFIESYRTNKIPYIYLVNAFPFVNKICFPTLYCFKSMKFLHKFYDNIYLTSYLCINWFKENIL